MHADPVRYWLLVQPDVVVQTREEPDRLFDVEPVAQAHTASAVVDAAIFAYAAPALHTVTTEGQAVTVEIDEMDVEDSAYVPLAQAMQIASDDDVAAVW